MRIRFSGHAALHRSARLHLRKGGLMRPTTTGQEAIGHDESPVHNWRVSQLERLGIPEPLAEIFADHIDWHQIARLVQRGCPPSLALRILC
jgi:hypothetical protein